MRRPRALLAASAALMLLLCYLPIGVVMVYSFNNSRYGHVWKGFTWNWYAGLWHNEQALAAANNMMILAGVSTVIATVIGTFLGVGMVRYSFPGKKWFSRLVQAPLVIPDIALAAALLLLYAMVRRWFGVFELGMTTMILGHVTFQIPIVAIVVRARMQAMDPSIDEAARDLGATSRQTFWHVTLPMILPAVIAGGALAFTLSLDDFVVSFFTTGPGATTLPIYIYSSVKRGITPEINALSTLMVAASLVGTLVIVALQKMRQD